MSSYRPDVDGLRALAVGAVILFHAFPPKLPGGFLGVDVFFVISGFLITGMVLDGIHAAAFSLLDRFLPAPGAPHPAGAADHVGRSFAAGDAGAHAGRDGGIRVQSHGRRVVRAQSGAGARAGVFRPGGRSTIRSCTCGRSGVEEQFYLVWPLALMLFVPRVRNRATVLVIAVIILLSLASEYRHGASRADRELLSSVHALLAAAHGRTAGGLR